MLISAGVLIAAFFGLLGTAIQAYFCWSLIGSACYLLLVISFVTRATLCANDDGIDLPMNDEQRILSRRHGLPATFAGRSSSGRKTVATPTTTSSARSA